MIQMINKGQSPNLRHVTRTHRVDLDWLFGRVTLDHSIFIKYVRTNDQLEDISIKGMFTTMQWQSFLHLWRKPYPSLLLLALVCVDTGCLVRDLGVLFCS